MRTENSLIAVVQSYSHCNGQDEHAGTKAHAYGSSHSNQRIECWWSSFRKSRSIWWINFFKDLIDSEELRTSNLLQGNKCTCQNHTNNILHLKVQMQKKNSVVLGVNLIAH